jgi:hypothetical protein
LEAVKAKIGRENRFNFARWRQLAAHLENVSGFLFSFEHKNDFHEAKEKFSLAVT